MMQDTSSQEGVTMSRQKKNEATEVAGAPSNSGGGTDRRDFLKRTAMAGVGASALAVLPVEGARANVTPERGNNGEELPGEASLGGNLTKVLFLTINVSDLDRAIEFYEATYPVKRAEVLDPPVQAFHGFGIPEGQFRARMMRDSQPFQGSAILLVQWLSPRPEGVPNPEANHVGWYREHANASQTGQTARYEQALANGGRPYGEPSLIYITPTLQIYAFGFRDPDGTTLEWVGPLDPTPGGQPDSVAGPNNNCRNLHRSYAWYKNVLGLDLQVRLNPDRLQPASSGSLGDLLRNPDGSPHPGPVNYDAAIMVPRADSRNSVDLLQWKVPPTYGSPYKHANNLGMMNLTYEVENIQVVYEKLLRVLPDPRKHIVAPPEMWDLGAFGQKKTLNILDPDGVMFQFIEKVHSTDPEP
jgi:catechol 2,3-dioxygenase-like lactoylglutathione lyase family enzyme